MYFSSVSLKILSPDGRTVLAELQQIDRVGQKTSRSVAAAGKAAVEDFSHQAALSSRRVAGELAMIAHEGQVSAKSLKSVAIEASSAAFAFGPQGIIAGAIALTGVAVFNFFRRTRDEIEQTAQKAREELEKLARSQDLTGVGRSAQYLFSGDPFAKIGGRKGGESDNAYLARTGGLQGVRAEIARLEAVKAAGSKRSGGLGLYTVMTEEARAAGESLLELARIEKDLDERHKASLGLLNQLADAEGYRATKIVEGLRAQGQAGRDKTLEDLTRGGLPGVSILGKPFASIADMEGFRNGLLQTVQKGLKPGDLSDSLARSGVQANATKEINAFADQLGQSFGRVLSDGIASGVTAGFQGGGIGGALKAMTAAILQGLGRMALEVGAAQLAISIKQKLWKDATTTFNPAIGIPAALGLIALGAGLIASGSSFSAGGGGGASAGGGYGYGNYPGTVYSLNPVAPPPNTAGLQAPRPVNIYNPVFLSPRDPNLQRQVAEVVKYATQRGDV